MLGVVLVFFSIGLFCVLILQMMNEKTKRRSCQNPMIDATVTRNVVRTEHEQGHKHILRNLEAGTKL